MSIRVDATASSALAVCSCGRFRALRTTRLEALAAGAAHERLEHDDAHAARALAEAKRRRGAAGSVR